MVGHTPHPEEPLMAAGLDSRGGMELRRALGDTLQVDLPVTLLYDYQTISAIVGFIDGMIKTQSNGQSEGQDGQLALPVGVSAATADTPSKLLKTLRSYSRLMITVQLGVTCLRAKQTCPA